MNASLGRAWPASPTPSSRYLSAKLKESDDARKGKLEALLAKVKATPAAPVPAHVTAAEKQRKAAETELKPVQAQFEKWEKGKLMSS